MTVSRVPNVEGGIQPTIVTAKGDLITAVANANPARLGVGSDGQLLTADSTSATGLSYQNNFAAGKNKIINGDFSINQRGFSSSTTNGLYGFDRWVAFLTDGTTNSYSAQTFTPGTAPVSGYEASNFARLISAGQTLTTAQTSLRQLIENVRTFAGQTVTVSFWAKANSGTPKVALELNQGFGSGGSSAVDTYGGQVTLTTSWARYSLTVSVPSISGKTIGSSNYFQVVFFVSAGSNFNSRTGSLGIQSNTFDFWGVQVEAGSTATAFQTATGTIQGELAACQRYYYRVVNGSDNFTQFSTFGIASSSTAATITVANPVPMRTNASSVDYASLSLYGGGVAGVGFLTVSSISIQRSNPFFAEIAVVTGSATTGYMYRFQSNNNSATYFGLSAEL
jgi:hypothetical protein